MTAPTARQVLASLDRSRQAIQMQALAALGGAGEAEVRRALSAVKPSAKIDIPVLLESVRRDLAERAADKRDINPVGIFKYGLSVMTGDRLLKLRDDLRKRVEAGEGDEPFLPGATRLRARGGDIEPDLDEDDDDMRPKSTPRRRLASAPESLEDGDLGEPAPALGPAGPTSRPARLLGRPARLLHGRVFVGGEPLDDGHFDFKTPP